MSERESPEAKYIKRHIETEEGGLLLASLQVLFGRTAGRWEMTAALAGRSETSFYDMPMKIRVGACVGQHSQGAQQDHIYLQRFSGEPHLCVCGLAEALAGNASD